VGAHRVFTLPGLSDRNHGRQPTFFHLGCLLLVSLSISRCINCADLPRTHYWHHLSGIYYKLTTQTIARREGSVCRPWVINVTKAALQGGDTHKKPPVVKGLSNSRPVFRKHPIRSSRENNGPRLHLLFEHLAYRRLSVYRRTSKSRQEISSFRLAEKDETCRAGPRSN